MLSNPILRQYFFSKHTKTLFNMLFRKWKLWITYIKVEEEFFFFFLNKVEEELKQ